MKCRVPHIIEIPNKTVSIPLVVSGSWDFNYAYYSIDGVAQSGTKGSNASEGTYSINTTIQSDQTLSIYVYSVMYPTGCYITLNDTTVLTGGGTYTLDISTLNTITLKFTKGMRGAYSCSITTT